MKLLSITSLLVLGMLLLLPGPAATQSTSPANVPDLNGVWQAPYTPDLSRAYKKDPPFTKYGAERYAKRDHSADSLAHCLPIGPNRAIQSPMPFQIIQTRDTIGLLFEIENTFRIIYLDGRSHPEELHDYPEWMGSSIGKFEGDTLVVETVGIEERVWLDTEGKEHSDKLRMIERFKKVDKDNISWTVAFEDPVFFSEPWSVTLPLKRQNTRIMSYSCLDNEKDEQHLVPTIGTQK